MKDDEVKQLLKSMMGAIKRFCKKTNKWYVLKRNPLKSAPATYTQNNLDNVLKLAAMYDSFGRLATDNLGSRFNLFTLDDQDEKLNVELNFGGNQGSKQHGSIVFRFGTSWETFFYSSDYYQLIYDLQKHFGMESIILDSSASRNNYVGHVLYFSKVHYNEFFAFIKKHFKIVNETDTGILVEFCKINKKNRTIDLLQLPHVKKLYDMLHKDYLKKYKAKFS